jgi:hypothetical protein
VLEVPAARVPELLAQALRDGVGAVPVGQVMAEPAIAARAPGRERWSLAVDELRDAWRRGLVPAWELADEPIGAAGAAR